MSNTFNSLKVLDKINETIDSCSFLLSIPEDLKDVYNFTSGQYITVSVNINGEEQRRAYSIFTSPSEDKFGFTVKRVDGGKVSNFLIDEVSIGGTLDIMAPEGKFILEPNVDLSRDHYFIAGGSGITPIMSMIITLLEEEPLSTAYLLYANRNENNIIFEKALNWLTEKYKDQLIVTYILSQPNREKTGGLKGLFSKGKTTWTGLTGRINKKCLANFLNDNPSKSKNDYFYLCGPGGLIETAEEFLKSKGIDSSKIKREYFSNAHEQKSGTQTEMSGECTADVQLNGEKFQINIPGDKTVLEALLDQGKDAPYSCTSGACSTCIAKVSKGKVEMDACFALDDDEIEKGFVLACQARVKTPELEINFDA
ncbi:MAG: ferredoxin--NADP reductase [Saprospiraceae bacterium]|nr:ferredoxin--NADP reductase [Bacteroidia bacterium]NNE14133.1 ferredoxin--NADP reductase [Saprospiraceae bacterium]NNL90954.1 ferredoxin--NADP reductase [Saprospiraceae bacterium]